MESPIYHKHFLKLRVLSQWRPVSVSGPLETFASAWAGPEASWRPGSSSGRQNPMKSCWSEDRPAGSPPALHVIRTPPQDHGSSAHPALEPLLQILHQSRPEGLSRRPIAPISAPLHYPQRWAGEPRATWPLNNKCTS